MSIIRKFSVAHKLVLTQYTFDNSVHFKSPSWNQTEYFVKNGTFSTSVIYGGSILLSVKCMCWPILVSQFYLKSINLPVYNSVLRIPTVYILLLPPLSVTSQV